MAREWLHAALYDLATIEEIIKDDFLTPISSFHAQQAVEKSLKAVLEYYEKEVPHIHNLKKLSELAKEFIEIDNIEILLKLDSIYIDARYPGELGLLSTGKPTVQEAREFYEFSKDVFNRICDLLDIRIEIK